MAEYKLLQIHNIQEYENFWENFEKHPEKYGNYWEPLFEWNITTIEDAKNEDIRKIFRTNVEILDDFIKWKDKLVWDCSCDKYKEDCSEKDPNVYTLKGVQITNEDFYWILKRDNKTKYLTCCAEIKPIKNK